MYFFFSYLLLHFLLSSKFSLAFYSRWNIGKSLAPSSIPAQQYDPLDSLCCSHHDCTGYVLLPCSVINPVLNSFRNHLFSPSAPNIYPNFHFVSRSYPPITINGKGYKFSQTQGLSMTVYEEQVTHISSFQLTNDPSCISIYYTTFWENLFTFAVQRQCPRERGCGKRHVVSLQSSIESTAFACVPIVITSRSVLTLHKLRIKTPNPHFVNFGFNDYFMFYPVPIAEFFIICSDKDLCDYITPYCLSSHFRYSDSYYFLPPEDLQYNTTGHIAYISHGNYSGCVTSFHFKLSEALDYIPLRFYNRTIVNSTNDRYMQMPYDHNVILNYSDTSSTVSAYYDSTRERIVYTVPFQSYFSVGPSFVGTILSFLVDEIYILLEQVLSFLLPVVTDFVNSLFLRFTELISTLLSTLATFNFPVWVLFALQSAITCAILNYNLRLSIVLTLFVSLLYIQSNFQTSI